MAGCRDSRVGYPVGRQFDADVTTRVTYESFHTNYSACGPLLMLAPTLPFQGTLNRSQSLVLSILGLTAIRSVLASGF